MDINYFKKTRILDGGMGQELLSRGLKTKGTLWSACALLDAEQNNLVYETHLDFAKAGADVIVTNTFTSRKTRLEENNVSEHFEAINKLAGQLAYSVKSIQPEIMIAGSLPPQNKTYIADLRPSDQIASDFYQQACCLESYIDFFYLDVMSSSREANIAIESIEAFRKPFLLGYHIDQGQHLPSGESLESALSQTNTKNCLGVILSCVSPETFLNNATVLQKVEKPFGFKLNGFQTTKPDEGFNEAMKLKKDNNPVNILGHRVDFSPPEFYKWVKDFYDQGATILGGCCETTPEHIKDISQIKYKEYLCG